MKKRHVMSALALALLPALAWGEGCQQADELYNRSLTHTLEREKLLLDAVSACPGHVKSLNNLAVLREEAGNLEEAEALYRRMIKEEPDFSAGHAGLGDVLAKRGNIRGALSAYNVFFDLLSASFRQGKGDPLQSHRRVYEARYQELQRKIDPSAKVDADTIVAALQSPAAGEAGKRGVIVKTVKPRIDIHIHFAVGSDQVEERSIEQLTQVAEALRSSRLSQTRIRIEGHTDADGAATYNRDLSLRRANTVRTMLTEHFHVEEARLEAVGRGEEAPVASNEDAQGRSLNRRVTFINLGGTGG